MEIPRHCRNGWLARSLGGVMVEGASVASACAVMQLGGLGWGSGRPRVLGWVWMDWDGS